MGQDFRLLSGDDATALPFLVQGGDGCISVTSNVVPGLCRGMFGRMQAGAMVKAQQLSVQICGPDIGAVSGDQPRTAQICPEFARSHVAQGSLTLG